MNTEPLDVLLEKLSAGNLDAAQQVFHDYEPYLRKVVRRHLPEQLVRNKYQQSHHCSFAIPEFAKSGQPILHS